jgi:hypothetical protein
VDDRFLRFALLPALERMGTGKEINHRLHGFHRLRNGMRSGNG